LAIIAVSPPLIVEPALIDDKAAIPGDALERVA
jgi:hypothetical protein